MSDVCQECHINSTSVTGTGRKGDCMCKAGYTWEHADQCNLCTYGKYKNTSGDDPCTDCTQDEYSNEIGATMNVCRACPLHSNMIKTAGVDTKCLCNAGWTASDVDIHSADACVQCGVDTYKGTTGNGNCNKCVVEYCLIFNNHWCHIECVWKMSIKFNCIKWE